MTTNGQSDTRAACPPAAATSAVVTIADRYSPARSFRAEWASPEYLIPLVAHFLAWADAGGHRLTVQAWLAYADTYPGTLPRHEITEAENINAEVGYRYQLLLREDTGGVLLRVYRLSEPDRPPGPRLLFELTTATLFAQAALMCEALAERAQRQADQRGGAALPGEDPAVWRRHEAAFRRIHASTPVTALRENLAAQFLPATFDVPYPAIRVAGAEVSAHVDRRGTVHVDVYVAGAQAWLLRRDRTVPVQITVQDTVVFQA